MTAREWRSLFGYESTWGIILGFMGVIYMVWLYLTWLPSYLEHERGLTVALTGWVIAIPYIFGTLGMLSAGQVADRLLRRGLSLVSEAARQPRLHGRHRRVDLDLLVARRRAAADTHLALGQAE